MSDKKEMITTEKPERTPARVVEGVSDGLHPPLSTLLLDQTAKRRAEAAAVALDPYVEKPLNESSNTSLVTLHQEAATRFGRYETEALFNQLHEIKAELLRRLELRSPDLRNESIKVGELVVNTNERYEGTIKSHLDGPAIAHLPSGTHALYLGRPAHAHEASHEVQKLRNLLLKGHPHVANTRCRAYEPREDNGLPGPRKPPMFCTLQEGHKGPHRNQHGQHLRPPFRFFRALHGYCRKCNAPWPCPTIREAGMFDHDLDAELRAGQGN